MTPRKQSPGLFLLLLLGLSQIVFSQAQLEESWEKRINALQPPDKVLAAIGVKPGMVVGEVGAGHGRYTVHLARKVGSGGKVYANDIDKTSLDSLRERCRRLGLTNVEIIRGHVDDPLFPPVSLDLAFMILTYHHLAEPVALLKNLGSSLKPGATVAIVDPDPVKDADRDGRETTSREQMEREAGQAGYDLVQVIDILAKDNIFILRPKRDAPALALRPSGPSEAFDPYLAVSGRGWTIVNRRATALVEDGRAFVRLDEQPGTGLAWLKGSLFAEGTIELDVRGKNVPQKSFVGLAFHGLDDETFEAVYFRPFNFGDPDPAKAAHGVQYVSHPEFTWQKLRADRPGEFEKAVRPLPDPDGWFHIRVEVRAGKVRVYVNSDPEPCLAVDELGGRKGGRAGLFVGNASGGDFAGLTIRADGKET